MLSFLNQFILGFDAPSPWGIYFQDSATPLPKWSGKSLMGIKLPNSGKVLELQVPSNHWKIICGWANHSCMVTSLKASEKNVGNRGSKSIICESIAVKEQRVNGSCIRYINKKYNLMLRCTLVVFERSYQIKIPSNSINSIRNLSTLNSKLDPSYVTGFTDGEGSSLEFSVDKFLIEFIELEGILIW